MKPSDLPEFRARTVRQFDAANVEIAEESAAARILPASSGHFVRDGLERQKARLTQRIVANSTENRQAIYGPPETLQHWRLAELFFVTSEMCALANQAAKTMPEFVLHRADLPADIGALYLDASSDAGPVDFEMLCLWGPDWARNAADLMVTMYAVNRGSGVMLRVFALHVEPELSCAGSSASTSGLDRVFDDACDLGLTVVGRTGRQMVFVVCSAEHDAEGDLLCYDLVPADPADRAVVAGVRLFND